MKESNFRSAVLKNLRTAGLFARCTEVPSDAGFPDSLVVHEDKSLFIEFKLYKTSNFWNHFQQTQINWYRQFLKAGNRKLYACFYRQRGVFDLFKITPKTLELETYPNIFEWSGFTCNGYQALTTQIERRIKCY